MSQVPETFCCHNLNCRLAKRKFSSALSPCLMSVIFYWHSHLPAVQFSVIYHSRAIVFFERESPSVSLNEECEFQNVNSKINSKSKVEVSRHIKIY